MASKNLAENIISSKVFLIAAILVAFTAGYFFSRTKYKSQILELNRLVQEKANQVDEMKSSGNKVSVVNGKILLYKDGIANELQSDLMLTSGDKVMVDGTFVMADGTKVELKDGDTIDMNGKMIGKSKK